MTLDDFKEVYADATPQQLLRLLVDALDHKGDERMEYVRSGNQEVRDWCIGEVKAMDERAEWIWDRLMDIFNGPYGKEPKRTQEFREFWSSKSTQGMVNICDIRHAICNSDQYPYPLWEKDYKHLEAQEAQTETINAVIAAIDRVPIYENDLDPDVVSRPALLDYLVGKVVEYGEDYGVSEMLMDIREFQIKRKRKE